NIKVTDFGIAKAATSTTMSTTGIGSVHYISPEQARGGYSDERSDIYSLGITMYEMVTGRVPFEGDTNVAIALMHIQNDMIPPRELYPDIYPSFEKIIMKATQKKPERRYLTAAALIADLNRVKDNPSIDIIVAPPSSVTGAPTQQFTNEDMQRIKEESSVKVANDHVYREEPAAGGSSEVSPDRSRIEAILRQAEEDEYSYEEEIPERRPEKKKGSIKKISDDDDEPYDDRYERDEEEDVDPKLEKAVMIGGIAAAVIVAVLLFVFIGNMAGWFDFGKKKETTEVTTEATTEEVVTEEKKIEMPDLVGLSQKAAEKDLKEAGLNNFQFVEENSVDVKEGYVISQNVEPKTSIAKDTQLIITVSAGAEELTISDVTDMDEDEAFKVLEKQGFKPTRSYKFDDDIDKGRVISTDPKAGEKLKAGETIVIYVSQGEEEKIVRVPDLSGLTETTARGSLESVGLSVGDVSYEYSSSIPEGEVVSQSIAPETEVKEGTAVGFVISKGAEKKSYRGRVNGTITTDDDSLWEENVKVTVFIADNSGTYQVYQTVAPGETIEIDGSYDALQFNNGTVTFIVETEDGEDVTDSYSQSLTLTYEEM
ncbi:MAG TPA: serine/threonine-protein kinase, partial [Lachnospiraceae bacterium]|nr:serine/threonine-protein kinase [Lachnospiraceae bacterium]